MNFLRDIFAAYSAARSARQLSSSLDAHRRRHLARQLAYWRGAPDHEVLRVATVGGDTLAQAECDRRGLVYHYKDAYDRIKHQIEAML